MTGQQLRGKEGWRSPPLAGVAGSPAPLVALPEPSLNIPSWSSISRYSEHAPILQVLLPLIRTSR
jgi:hypothetical protein